MLTYSVALLHDKSRQYTAASTQALLHHLNWELFDHPPYSIDLAPSDYRLFARNYQKKLLKSELSNNKEELMEAVKT
jgi:histone-lysine N-methyltransferase SETMAR